MMLTGGKIDGKEAGKFGLVVKSVPDNTLNSEVETMTEQMSRAPINQPELRCTKWQFNQTIEASGLISTQRLATLFDGITRHSHKGINFKTTPKRLAGSKRSTPVIAAGSTEPTITNLTDPNQLRLLES